MVDCWWWIVGGGLLVVDCWWWIVGGGLLVVDCWWWIVGGSFVGFCGIFLLIELLYVVMLLLGLSLVR